MPRYFFHIDLGLTYIHDHYGADHQDDAAARRRAVEDIQAVWRAQAIGRIDPKKCAVVVKDQGGRELFRVPFTDVPGVVPVT